MEPMHSTTLLPDPDRVASIITEVDGIPFAVTSIRELEGALGRVHLENDLLRRALKQAEKEALCPGEMAGDPGEPEVLAQLPLVRAWALLGLNRGSCYCLAARVAGARRCRTPR